MRGNEAVERALELSTTGNMVAIAEAQSTVNLRWAVNTLTTNGRSESTALSVVAIDGPRVGSVTRPIADADDVRAIVEAAEAVARTAVPAEDAAELGPTGPLSLTWSEDAAGTSAAVFDAVAPDLGQMLRAGAGEQREVFGYAEHVLSTTWLGTTAGSRLRHDQPEGRIEFTVKSHDRTRSTYVAQRTDHFRDVDIAAIDHEARKRLQWHDRTIDIDPGRYDVVIPGGALADLMFMVLWYSSSRDAEEGQTVFSKPGGGVRIGERLSRRSLSMRSDSDYAGITCQPFVSATGSSAFTSVFDNGLTLPATSWIDQGSLSALVETRHTAAQFGRGYTPFVDNLILEEPGATGSLEDIVASTQRGLLVTTFWYIREVDPTTLLLTGLTRDGVYLIENGEVTGAVNNFRFNESPVDMLDRFDAVGATTITQPREWADDYARCAMPPVRVSDFNMSTVSPAS
jgi:predicted Zn-dependent protease